MAACKSCGEELPAEAKFCPVCGTPAALAKTLRRPVGAAAAALLLWAFGVYEVTLGVVSLLLNLAPPPPIYLLAYPDLSFNLGVVLLIFGCLSIASASGLWWMKRGGAALGLVVMAFGIVVSSQGVPVVSLAPWNPPDAQTLITTIAADIVIVYLIVSSLKDFQPT